MAETTIDQRSAASDSRQFGGKIGSTVIDRGVEAKFVLHESTFRGSADDADRSRARDLSELADQGPDGSTRGSDDHSFARLRLADQAQTGIGGETWHAEHAEACRDRRHGGIKLLKTGAIRQRVRRGS